ncbi:MAG TPA: SPOR domain-containing protein [Prolixibacteraceae bacterium]|nr:SPOR domain-containing protein [Prolixibacteraceae bacterium]
MEINQYIKELLLLNDCVIIPEFGGFVANYKPATFENNQFFPPTKELAFNTKLISNDGLLINYIVEAEGLNYFSAKQKLEGFVEETLLNLERNRNVYFEGVGYLHYDSRENLQFETQMKQNLLVDSFGLQNFSYEKLYQRQVPKPAFRIEHHEPIPVIFQKRKLKKMIVAVPLLIAMALIPLKHNKEYLSKSDMGMWETLMQNTPAAPSITQEQNVAEYTANVTTAKTEQLRYFIIGGSFKSEENADKYIQQLKEKGYTGQNLGIFKGLNRVAMKGFATMEEAQKELNSFLYKNPRSGVWIHVSE